ncbi:MAG: UbiD family decarboxylase [Xanthobacteraceae bacterium]|nr:UbiD family decarboxylase [Xanthobacteraceae bacterium]
MTKQATADDKKSAGEKRAYLDLHEHIDALRKKGLLIEIDRLINKDTEMHPLVRWQFRGGIAPEDRKAFLFTNLTDSKGRKFDIPVLVCGLAGNNEIYSMGMGCKIADVRDTWLKAFANPIKSCPVENAPCQEIVYTGDDIRKGHGLDDIPVPISSPGWDNAPYTTSSHFITVDPDTGVQNLGTYRGMIKAPDRMGMNTSIELRSGGYMHWQKYKAMGKPMPCAVVLGCPPVVSYTSVQKVPEIYDELDIAGGLAGGPINVTRCKTVDLFVPAEAEIVIEGYVSTEFLEPEAPFGESHGHVNLQEYNGVVDVTAITRRKKAILTSWISQVTPSESSCIKRPAYEAAQMLHLRTNLGIQGIRKVVTHEPLTALQRLIVVVVEKNMPRTEIWRALYGVASFRRAEGKWVVAVNEDIDPDNADATFWAMCFRCKPHNDVKILHHKDEGHGPRSMYDSEDSAVLIDATLKETLPPVALPKREFMEKAKEIWEEIGLPKLRPESPWFGYDLGEWNEHLERQAQLAVQSEYWKTGEWCIQRRRSDVGMNTELRTLDDEPDYTIVRKERADRRVR